MRIRTDIPALTCIRGAAALWVALYHLLLPAGFVTGMPAALLGRGYLAVDLFFVLSGFVMALTYGAQFQAAVTVQAASGFLLRRVARLYPLYALIVLFRFGYTYARYGGFALPRPWIAAPMAHPAADMVANLLLVQAWGLAGSSIGTAWSISTEWGAYFMFPALCAVMMRGSARNAACATGVAILLVLAAAANDAAGGFHAGLLDAWDGRSAGPMLRCLGGFTLGMAVWRVSRIPAVARLAGTWRVGAAVFTLFAAMLLAGAPDLAVYPLFPLMVLCLATAPAPGVWGSRPLVWLGEISYALYLLHIFLLHPLDVARMSARLVLPPGIADWLAVTGMFAILLALSDACYRRIEMPGRSLVLHLGARLAARWPKHMPGQGKALAPRLTPNI